MTESVQWFPVVGDGDAKCHNCGHPASFHIFYDRSKREWYCQEMHCTCHCGVDISLRGEPKRTAAGLRLP